MSKTKSLLDRLLNDWVAKILCLLGAVGLFFFYQLNKLEERALSVPLTVLTNDDFVPASQYPRTVRLVLRGESNAIGAILEDDLEATLDLAGYTSAGVWRVPVRIEKRGSAMDIDPLEITVDPSDIALSIELRAVRQLKIVPSFRGFLEPGYELAGFTLDPPLMEAVGPSGLMDRITEVTTEAIELSGKSANFTARVRIQKRDSLVGFLSSDTVQFNAEVRRALVYKTFQDLPVEALGLQPGLEISGSLPAVTVVVAAARSAMDQFVMEQDVLVIDLSGVKTPGTYTFAVAPRFPADFLVESWIPQALTLVIDKSAAVPEVKP